MFKRFIDAGMSLHAIVGAGPVGTGAARLLAERDERVRLASARRRPDETSSC
jgi:2-polyprenyl-6-methoxyphenol hydroxylase-like FAD-dependent oxidoreductase